MLDNWGTVVLIRFFCLYYINTYLANSPDSFIPRYITARVFLKKSGGVVVGNNNPDFSDRQKRDSRIKGS